MASVPKKRVPKIAKAALVTESVADAVQDSIQDPVAVQDPAAIQEPVPSAPVQEQQKEIDDLKQQLGKK